MTENEDKTPVAQNVVTKCAKCKVLIDHVIISQNAEGVIEKVKCLTCGSEHKYHPEKIKLPRKKVVRAKKVDPARDFALLTERFKGKKPLRYTMAGSFRTEDIIDHNIFGMGVVISAFNRQMEVIFSDRPRILVFDRQDIGTSK